MLGLTVFLMILSRRRLSVFETVYPHMPILRVARAHARVARAMAAQRGRRNRFVRFWASGGAKFSKMWDFVLSTPMNHRAKFDAASFILGEKNP